MKARDAIDGVIEWAKDAYESAFKAAPYIIAVVAFFAIPSQCLRLDTLRKLSARQMDAFEKGDFEKARHLGEDMFSALDAEQ